MEIVFEKPWVLLLGLVIPLLVVLHFFFFEKAKKRAIRFANFSAMKRVTGSKFIAKNTSQLIFRLIILVSFILGLAHPIIWYEGKASINDYVLVIDSSSSMLADDLKPDRLTVAKQAASVFLDNVHSYAEIGVVSFAGVSFIKSPLSPDTTTLKRKIEEIDIQLGGGTDIGGALVTSANLFKEDKKVKAIILLTDGSDTAGSFVDESVDNALDYMADRHVIVNTIGIGGGEGSAGYFNSSVLLPVYNTETLKKIADRSGGKFYEAKSPQEISSAFKDILEDTTDKKISYDASFVLLFNAFLLLFIEWGLLNTKFRALP
jgi:Ca-activated chloride channel family protein